MLKHQTRKQVWKLEMRATCGCFVLSHLSFLNVLIYS